MKRLLLLFGSIFYASFSFSQLQVTRDVLATSGSEMSNGTLEISFTLGETFTALYNEPTFGTTWEPAEAQTLGFQQTNFSFVSIYELENDVISLFPNPANEQITFTTSSEAPFTFRVHDITGRIVKVGRSTNGVLLLNINDVEIGKYYLEYVPESGETQYLPFIKML